MRPEDIRVDLAEPLELLVAQDRVRDHELARVLRGLVEQVALRADAGLDAHHDGLADRVDRRVRHLGEQLLEVRVEHRLPVGENGQRQVVAHRPDRLLRVPRERGEDHLHVVLRVPERELARAERLRGAGEVRPRRQILEPHDLVPVPLGVRPSRRNGSLHLLVRNDPAALDVDEEQLPGLQAALPDDVLRRLLEHTGLGGEDDPAVRGLEPPAGTQAVAVERRADHAAVREGDRRRAVPGLHQALVVGVEPLELGRDVVPALVGLGDHHHDRVRQRPPREHQQLEHVVERRGVRAAGTNDGQDLREVVAEELRGELRLARAHPVDVAAKRVDLAVVSDHPVRMRELPARERVGRVAGVHERERRRGALVLQVRVVAGQLRRGQHALVDHGAGREARDHEVGAGGQLGHPPDHVQLALERVALEPRRSGDEELTDTWSSRGGGLAGVALVDRNVTPGDHCLPLRLDRLGQELLERRGASGLAGQEAHGDAVAAELGKRGADLGTEQGVRQLQRHARTVAAGGVGAGSAAVLEVGQCSRRPHDRLVTGDAVQARDERHAAGVVLVRGVVEADCLHSPVSLA